jgi:hypothetical protein
MRVGDRVLVVDPSSSDYGSEGVIVRLTRSGRLFVRLSDRAEVFHAQQVDSVLKPDLRLLMALDPGYPPSRGVKLARPVRG